MKTNNIELINTFAAKVLAGETDFMLGDYAYISAQHGHARAYYCAGTDWTTEANSNRYIQLVAVYSDKTGKIYITNVIHFNLYHWEEYDLSEMDEHIVRVENLVKQLREEIDRCYPDFYDSVKPTQFEWLEQRKRNFVDALRWEAIYGRNNVTIGLAKLSNKEVLEMLESGETLESAAKKYLEENAEKIDMRKTRAEYEKTIRDQDIAEQWEISIGRALNVLEAKTVVVEYEIDGKTAVGKMKPNDICRSVYNKFDFSYWYFSTRAEGERVYKELRLEGKHSVLYAKDIKSISYRGKKIYQRPETVESA